jgi:hypothetical protein
MTAIMPVMVTVGSTAAASLSNHAYRPGCAITHPG